MDRQLHLDTETVDHAFPTEPLVVAPQAKVRDVIRRMAEANQGSVVVCRESKVVGVFTERDALVMMARNVDMSTPIAEVMTRDPDTLRQQDRVAHAILKMSTGGYRRVPIIDNEGRPVGVIRVAGILHYLVEHFPKVVYTLPPKPHHGMQEREGA